MSTDTAPAEQLAPLDMLYLMRVTMTSNQIMLQTLVQRYGYNMPLQSKLLAEQQIKTYAVMIAKLSSWIAEMEGANEPTAL